VKAIRFHQHGGPEVLRYEDAPTPEPGPGEVLVALRAAALNHLDIFTRSGGVWTQQGTKLVGAGAVGTHACPNESIAKRACVQTVESETKTMSDALTCGNPLAERSSLWLEDINILRLAIT